MTNTKKRILIGSPVLQKPEILKEYLDSLDRLDKENLEVEYMFVNDNVDPASKELMSKFKSDHEHVKIIEGGDDSNYKCDEHTHYWSSELMNRVGNHKNKIIEHAIQNNFDYILFVDSDLVLNKRLLKHLISCEKDIVSEIFWTKWTPQSLYSEPNVWLYDQYSFVHPKQSSGATPIEIIKMKIEFLNKLRQPGVYKVGGLGACTLISRNAILKGVNFSSIENFTTLVGEDRFFCVRAVALGLGLFVDTTYPAYHIYRETDLAGVENYIAQNE